MQARESPSHGSDRLNVRVRCTLLFIRLLLSCFLPGLQWGILPDVRGQDLHDRLVVFFGLSSDPFEGVDTAYPDLEQLVVILVNLPELVNGPREAVCDLPLLSSLCVCSWLLRACRSCFSVFSRACSS